MKVLVLKDLLKVHEFIEKYVIHYFKENIIGCRGNTKQEEKHFFHCGFTSRSCRQRGK